MSAHMTFIFLKPVTLDRQFTNPKRLESLLKVLKSFEMLDLKVLESLFNKGAGVNFIKKNIAKFLRAVFLLNTSGGFFWG